MFPRIRGTFVGVPIIGIIIYLGLYWGPLILGNYHIGLYRGQGLGFGGILATMENHKWIKKMEMAWKLGVRGEKDVSNN